MSYNIIWTDEAIATFEDRIGYLKIHWTEKEISKFKLRVVAYLETLTETPYIGKKPGRMKDVYMGLILKQVSIIYRVKINSKQIELISFIDNRQDPKKIRKYKLL
jgi:plasmid stabilization system protein ParE